MSDSKAIEGILSGHSETRIIVGGLQAGPEDPLPSPVVAVSYQSLEEAASAAKLLLSIQNGSRPFSTGPPVYLGDTRIKVGFQGRRDRVLCVVEAKSDPGHLTYAFYASGLVSMEQFDAFRQLLDVSRNYVFTIARGEEVLTKELYLVKYAVEERGIQR